MGKLFNFDSRTYIFSGDGAALLGSFQGDEEIPELVPFNRDAGAKAEPGSEREEMGPGLAAASLPFRADLNADGVVDDADLTILLNRFGQATCCLAGGDLNGDRVVDGADLRLLLAEFGAVGPARRTADLNGDGAIDGFDLRIFLRAMRGRSSGDSLAADVNGDGALDRRDLVEMMSQAVGGEEEELCAEMEDLGLVEPGKCDAIGDGGPLDELIPPGPRPPVDCESLPRHNPVDCLNYATCVAEDEHGDELDDLREAKEAARDALEDAVENYENVRDSGQERQALNNAQASRDALLTQALDRLAEAMNSNSEQKMVVGAATGAGAGLLGGIGVAQLAPALAAGPIGVIVVIGGTALLGILLAEVVVAVDLLYDLEAFEMAREDLIAAGNGQSTGVAAPPGLFAAGQAVAAASAAYGAAESAAQQAIWDALQDFNAASAALAQAEEQLILEIAQTIVDCLREIKEGL